MAPDALAIAVKDKLRKFIDAALIGNFDLLRKLAGKFNEGRELDLALAGIKDANKQVALQFEALEGKAKGCTFFFGDMKHSVDGKDPNGDTSRVYATRRGHTTTAKYLLNHGTNPRLSGGIGAAAVRPSAGTEYSWVGERMTSYLWRKFTDYRYTKWERTLLWDMVEPYRRPKTFTPLILLYTAAFYTGVIGAAITEQLYKEKYWEEHPGQAVPLMQPKFYWGPWRVQRGDVPASLPKTQKQDS